MKNIVPGLIFISFLFFTPYRDSEIPIKKGIAQNLFIITTDGFRWQELFTGADSILINDEKYTQDRETTKSMYWSDDAADRRRKLMPFMWNVIAGRGQLYGNRREGNCMNVSNIYASSYPGYNELLTGTTDLRIYKNDKKLNPNINLLEYLNARDSFVNKVAAFSSWNLFPYILNQERNSLPVNSGYDLIKDSALSDDESIVNVASEIIKEKASTRHDRLTFMAAKSYVEKNRPRILLLSLGETDEFAHSSRYDLYLQQAHDVDAMIAELWHWVQITPGYKDNTVFVITTDHGRGAATGKWNVHGLFTKGSSETWMACLGPGIEPLGEIKKQQQIYNRQLPGFMASILGLDFPAGTSEVLTSKLVSHP
jgi:hypothetical protein